MPWLVETNLTSAGQPDLRDRFLPSGEQVGNIRFGFRLSPDGKHVEPVPGEQSVLTEIRHLRQSGHTLRGIAAALNYKALGTRRCSAWRLEHVARIVKHPRLQ